MATRDDENLLDLSRQRFDLAEDAEKGQLDRELDDLRLYNGDQWSDADLKARGAQPATGNLPPAPARPSLVVNKLREPVRSVLNSERQAEMGLELVPADDFAALIGPSDDSEIELREGLIRRIQRESQAADARTWAFNRATIAGRGYYAVLTRYLPGKTWDQEIYVHRYFNQRCVRLDPAHEQPDGSDAEWAHVETYLRWDQYKSEYGRVNDKPNDVVSLNGDAFDALGETYPGWFATDGDVRMVRVVEYWYVEREARDLVDLGGEAFYRDEIPEGYDLPDDVPTRTVIEKRVKWCKHDGSQVLDKTDWPGHFIPIVKVLGDEMQPHDKERRVEGMVRSARDSQVGFNAMISKWVELVGLTPPPAYVATPEQTENFEQLYQTANTRAWPIHYYNPVTVAGNLLPPPQRVAYQTPIEPIAASVQMFDQAIKSTTGVPDPTLGNIDPSLRSGKAIRFLQEQAQHGTSNYLDNLKRSIRFEGVLINDLLYPVYGKRGRVARILNKTGEPQVVQIGQPAQAMPAGVKPLKQYQLTEDANVNVIVKVAKSQESRRQQQAEFIGNLLSANPAFITAFGDKFFEVLDVPAHQELAERAKLLLDPRIQQAEQMQKQGLMNPETQQAVMPLMQRLQQAEQLLQQAQQELGLKQADARIKLQIAQLDAEKEFRLQAMKDASAIAVAKINAMTKGVIADNEAQVEALALQAEQDRTAAQLLHDTRTQARDHAHEHVQSQMDRAHEAVTQAQSQAHQSATQQIQQQADFAEAESQRAHDVEMQPAEQPSDESEV